MKTEIVAKLGESELLLPSLIGEGLAANDRVKTRLSIMQAAAEHAYDPTHVRFDLTAECRAAGIDPVAMERLVNRAALFGADRIAAPGLADLETAIWSDVATMTEAVAAGDREQGDAARTRVAAIKSDTGAQPSDDVAFAHIGRLIALADGAGDSLHRIVMDLHKMLNGLAAAHAEETVMGARVYGLQGQDRTAVQAFMRGVEATQRLKFGHPGLSTMATRSDARLIIQNDIGETDAHVVIIAVEQNAITITYTDVHLPRAKFFTGLFQNLTVQWSGLERRAVTGLGDDGGFYLMTGQFPIETIDKRDAVLETIGASLVFLIDWNKARKVLRTLVPNDDAVKVLEWSARHRFGHRGFLELGGSELVASAVRHAAPTRIGFGERLDQTMGRDAAIDFLKTVMRVSTEALLTGGSVRLVRDRIESDLMRHLQRIESTLLKVAVRQAGLARQIAAGIVQFITDKQTNRPFDCAELASQAHRIEEKADRIIVEARAEIARFEADRLIERLVNALEDAIDELEQAAFAATLVPDQIGDDLIEPLRKLSVAAVCGAEAAAIAAAAAANVPEGHRLDPEEALGAVGRLIEAEHNGDAAERAIMSTLLRGHFDLKCALSVVELARALERATDRLAGFGHVLREYLIADLVP